MNNQITFTPKPHTLERLKSYGVGVELAAKRTIEIYQAMMDELLVGTQGKLTLEQIKLWIAVVDLHTAQGVTLGKVLQHELLVDALLELEGAEIVAINDALGRLAHLNAETVTAADCAKVGLVLKRN